MRTHTKTFDIRFTEKEYERLCKRAEKSGLPKTTYIRHMINGYAPKEQPPVSFYDFLSRWAVHPVEVAWERQKQFIADASHELKTPLTVILSNADMLCKDGTFEDKKMTRRMEHIKSEAGRMKHLVDDMLSLARSDNVGKTAVPGKIDFSDIVTSAMLIYEPILYDEKKKLIYDVNSNLIVSGDAEQLQQLIHVLMDNAAKYCSEGGFVKVELLATDRKHVLLKVYNDGEPIPKEDLSKIFLRFYRRDEARSAQGGFGLGLSIARAIVSDHSGKIWAENSKEQGNTFCVLLPLA